MNNHIRTSALWKATVASLRLSPRQQQIVECLLDLEDDETHIATRLDMSKHTVHTHLQRIHGKLGVSTQCQILARVFGRYAELVDDPSRPARPADPAGRAGRRPTR